jgi:hypothetical protein
MAPPSSWQVYAHNQASASENRIHDDTVAQRYGFRGGLVPGVTVYAYLVHPAIVDWGLEWLSQGTASADFRKPIYDGDLARVEVTAEGPHAYQGAVIDPEGRTCATGQVSLTQDPGEAPKRRGDPPAPSGDARPEATRATLERLQSEGMGSVRAYWRGEPPWDRYSRALAETAELVQPDGGGFANPAFTLGLANWVLAANVRLGPWIHAQSEVQNHAAIPLGSALDVEAQVVDLFEQKGHQFVDLEVTAFLDSDRPAMRAHHRAIYRLRKP